MLPMPLPDRWLKECDDGLFRPQPVYWEERPTALVNVRTQVQGCIILLSCRGPSIHKQGPARIMCLSRARPLLAHFILHQSEQCSSSFHYEMLQDMECVWTGPSSLQVTGC
eukprot:scaffold44594_cov21-Tisochrysis_lutea.AAC.3